MTVITPKGWCPTLYAPMPTGDGLLVRVKPPAGILSAAAARTLAKAATRHGNGIIELTNRASLQIRGLSARTTAPFAAAMVAAGLADADPAIERRRSVIASPLAGDDPGVSRHTASVTAAIEAMLANQTALAALPAKFGFLVDGGGVLPVSAAGADIRIVLDGDACWVTPDGADLGVACDPADAANVAVQLALAFVECARACPAPPRRMRALIADIGAPTVMSFTVTHSVGTPAVAPGRPFSAVGWLRYGTLRRGAFGPGLPFGAIDADTMTALANLADHHGDGTLRLTPWRALALPGVTEPDVLRKAASALGLIIDGNDPRTRLFACPGSPTCPSATVETRVLAASLTTLRSTETLHVSGCAKGCAHPSAANLTLVGEAGRYGIVHDGRASDTPFCRGLTAQEVIAHLRRHTQMAVT